MNGYEVVSPLALYDAMNEINQARDKQFQAQSMINTNGWGGGAGIIGAALGGLLAGQQGRHANNLEAEHAKNQFIYEQQQAALAQKAKAKAEADKRQQDLDDKEAERAHEMNLSTTKATTGHSNALALQDDRQAFEAQQEADKRAYEAANKKPDYSAGDALRKEFHNLPPVKQFDEVNTSMQKVINSAKDSTGATDIALITGFMKMNDPGSTVREGEFKTAADAGSANQKFWGLYESIKSGQTLTPEQRGYFVDSAYRLYDTHSNQYSRLKSNYDALALQRGLDPQQVFIDRKVIEAPKKEQQPQKVDPSKYEYIDGKWYEK